MPSVQIVIFAIAAIIVGILAAIFPARRAARLNVLEALQYEWLPEARAGAYTNWAGSTAVRRAAPREGWDDEPREQPQGRG